VPRIAYFLGISIYLYLDDHGTPHCHAMYGDYMVISPAGWILARGADASTATEINSEFYQQ